MTTTGSVNICAKKDEEIYIENSIVDVPNSLVPNKFLIKDSENIIKYDSFYDKNSGIQNILMEF